MYMYIPGLIKIMMLDALHVYHCLPSWPLKVSNDYIMYMYVTFPGLHYCPLALLYTCLHFSMVEMAIIMVHIVLTHLVACSL
jgi:hypothetical protein